jgi:hypothetical protein
MVDATDRVCVAVSGEKSRTGLLLFDVDAFLIGDDRTLQEFLRFRSTQSLRFQSQWSHQTIASYRRQPLTDRDVSDGTESTEFDTAISHQKWLL